VNRFYFNAHCAHSDFFRFLSIAIVFLLFSPSIFCYANESNVAFSPDDSVTEMVSTVGQLAHQGLAWLDWVVVACYVGGVLTLGWYYSRKQSSTGEYFVGSMHMPPWLIGISIYATLLSTISYLAQPGEVIKHGPSFILGALVSIVLSYFIVGYGLIPLIMKQRVTSAYELLEAQLGLGGRLLGACMFIVLRLVWMSLLIYLATSALLVIMDLGSEWRPLLVMAIGLVAITYTSLGGLQAVVITDCAQFCLLLLGALTTIIMISFQSSSFFSWWPTQWVSTWDNQPLFSLDPRIRVSVFGALVSTLIWRVSTAGGDQTAIQRFMATGDAIAARKSYLVNTYISIAVTLVLGLLGLALLGFFAEHPQMLPSGATVSSSADNLFPYFIANYLPIGLSGLVVAAMFAAAMSSIDSGVNSITAVVMTDFLDRFGLRPKSEATHLRYAMYLAFVIGLIVVYLSSFLEHVTGNFLAVTEKTDGLLAAPIFCLFILALFVTFSKPLGALIGAIYGIAAATLVAFWDNITGQPSLSFQWIGLYALVINLSVSTLVSYFGPRRDNLKANLLLGAILIIFLFAILTLILKYVEI
jgi:SSS family solute:Na+ symporter